MPVATGETNFGVSEFAGLIAADAADILMPNLQRVGGLTGWLRIAEAAALRGVGIASHVHAQFALSLMCGVQNAVTLEYVPWWPNPFEQEIRFENGQALAFEEPGFGLTLDEARLRLNPA
jgi:L-alanine-DL-glutamate epimerase-like enolase superfamily enzyme